VRPQQRRGRHRRERRAEVGEVEVGGVGHAGHLVGDERRSAERAGALVVVHPAVQAPAVEDVAAVGEPAHLVAAADVTEADRAVPPAVGGGGREAELVEAHHGEHLLDDHRRHRAELRPAVLQQHRCLRRRRAVRRVVVLQVVVAEVQQVAEADGVERPEEEAADVAEQEEEVEQLLGEHQLRAPHREPHACRLSGLAACVSVCAEGYGGCGNGGEGEAADMPRWRMRGRERGERGRGWVYKECLFQRFLIFMN
jgi:hypothetical protein